MSYILYILGKGREEGGIIGRWRNSEIMKCKIVGHIDTDDEE
jgi:hypothetical protein